MNSWARAWSAVSAHIRRRFAIHRYRTALDAMSDATLRDIGIARDDIADVVQAHLDSAGRPIGGYPF